MAISRSALLLGAAFSTGLWATSLAAQDTAAVPATATATAQDPATQNSVDDGIGEIIVTAQRRAQNLQDVPISVTAFDENAIRESGFTNSLSIGDCTTKPAAG